MCDMMAPESSEAVDFGPFRLYVRHRKLFYGREEIHLGGRAMDVLLALARNKGELVTKEQLVEAAWPNVSVHESNLKVTVASLRRALRECAESPSAANAMTHGCPPTDVMIANP
jgi:DNA-binding winged helix-turn-helix (wHTH) protein